jgi:hypothetical protein
MKLRLIAFLITLTMIAMAAPQVFALDIMVDDQGTIRFYQDRVLGKNTGLMNSVKSDSSMPYGTGLIPPKNNEAPIRTVPTGERKKLEIKANNIGNTVQLKEKVSNHGKDSFIRTETMESDQVRANFPAKLTKDQVGIAEKKHEEYQQKLREERQERNQEKIEVRSRAENKHNSLELKSRNTKALLKEGTDFNLDPKTNEVTLVTPSGQEHTLNHLPDQAIERMKTAGFFNEASAALEEEIAVETNDQGELVYRKKDKIKKRIFGFFPRQIDSEILLNDTTGEVSEKELAPNSLFEGFLNAVSF